MYFSEVILTSESGASHFNFLNYKPTGSRSRPCAKSFDDKCTENLVSKSNGLLCIHHIAEL